MSNFRAKQTYKQQRIIKFTIITAAVVLILCFYFGSLVGLYTLIKKHTHEFLIVSQVKLENIRSATVAELRQNDLQLVSSDVWASAKAISDLVSYVDDSDIIDEGFAEKGLYKARNTWEFAANIAST